VFVSSIQSNTMKLECASKILKAALEESEKLDVKMNVAVVDCGGNMVTFARMDGAWLGSADIALKKAKTSVMFCMPSGEIGKLSQPGGPLYNIEHSNGGLISFPGGVPIEIDGKVVGAIGVSGSTVENDHQVAAAGVTAAQ